MDMEFCFLCLNTESSMAGSVRINSVRWQTENIKYLIEKHLWPMDTANDSGRMCIECYNELNTFHTFYVRVKEAHAMLKKRDVIGWMQNENSCDIKSSFGCKEENCESNIETEICIEQSLTAECESINPLIKEEQEHETLLDDMPLKQRRKRGRPPKDVGNELTNNNKEPLKKRNTSKSLDKIKKQKEIVKNLSVLLQTSLKTNENELSVIETEKAIMKNSNENSESDSEYEVHNEKQIPEIHKKKRKNPDEITRQEHDKIIAEYFKIFCSLCQIPIDNFIALRKHFREEHKKRGFVICCKKKIFTRPILVDHIRFHLDPNFFKCTHCSKVYSDRCTLESHIKHHEDGQHERNHTCDTCGKSFVGITQLESHKLTHAPDYEKKFSCSDCGKFFTTLYSLNYHIQAIHHNKYVKICDICGKTMRCRNSFKLHMEKHDNKLATPIHCDICGLRLIDRRGLRRHKNSQHPVGGQKEYTCHICSKVSPNLRALRTHIRFAHETGYIHKCTMCDKAFKRPEALKEHMATHTGTPLYTCPWCPKTFISNGNMHNHRKKSHPKEWEEAQRQKYGGIFPSNYKSQQMQI